MGIKQNEIGMRSHLIMATHQFNHMYIQTILGQNWHLRIINDISHIRFPRLKLINLSKNNIVSAERLSRMEIPALEELFICNAFNYSRGKQAGQSQELQEKRVSNSQALFL